MNDQPVMYIFVNKGLRMSSGKLMAQAAHAAVEAYLISGEEAVESWMLGKHHTKIILEARDATHLRSIKDYLFAGGVQSEMIIDEGRNEIDPHTPTALGVQIVNKKSEHVQALFSTFDSWKDTIKVTLEIPR